MKNSKDKSILFLDYYAGWVDLYKEGAVRDVTLDKYKATLKWIERLAPDLKLEDLNRETYQQLLNTFAATHEKQTTKDFHHQMKSALIDAYEEGLIAKDPTRRAIVKGRPPKKSKKKKYLNQSELQKLVSDLYLGRDVTWDWFILLVAKTGLRFAEALALTPNDFDFEQHIINVSKTWDYKNGNGFLPTKNKSSVRKVPIDKTLSRQFRKLTKRLDESEPIFVDGPVYNSTVNYNLAKHCKRMHIPVITIHGLRHTHASVLLFAGVSVASVARRLGHSNMSTTQKTYLHIIQELDTRDNDIIMKSLSALN